MSCVGVVVGVGAIDRSIDEDKELEFPVLSGIRLGRARVALRRQLQREMDYTVQVRGIVHRVTTPYIVVVVVVINSWLCMCRVGSHMPTTGMALHSPVSCCMFHTGIFHAGMFHAGMFHAVQSCLAVSVSRIDIF